MNNISERRNHRVFRMSISKQQGFTLVELMIAGILGLFLISGVIQLFTGSNRIYSMQEELASLQENGRFALTYMDSQIRMGAWTVDESPPQAIDIANSSDGTNDTIVVSYKVAVDGVSNLDCNGEVIADGVIRNTFSVNSGNFQCQGNGGGAAQTLVSSVDSFQVLYGVETDAVCPDGVVNSYMSRDAVNAALLNEKVISVQVALLLRSNTEVLQESKAENFVFLDKNLKLSADKMARRLFQQTIFIPNAVYRTVGTPEAVIDCMISKV